MKMKALAAATLMGLGMAANAYQIEATVGWNQLQFDASAMDDQDTYMLGAEYHFSAVDTSGKPLAEAAFLNRSSNVFVTADVIDDGDNNNYKQVLGTEIYIPNTMFYASAWVTNTNFNGMDSEQDFSIALGITPIDGLLVRVVYEQMEGLLEDEIGMGIDAKYVAELGGFFVNFEAGFTALDEADDDIIDLAADFYIDKTWSVGLAYRDDGDDNVTIRTRKFFTDSIAAGFSYTQADDDDVFQLDFSMRF